MGREHFRTVRQVALTTLMSLGPAAVLACQDADESADYCSTRLRSISFVGPATGLASLEIGSQNKSGERTIRLNFGERFSPDKPVLVTSGTCIENQVHFSFAFPSPNPKEVSSLEVDVLGTFTSEDAGFGIWRGRANRTSDDQQHPGQLPLTYRGAWQTGDPFTESHE